MKICLILEGSYPYVRGGVSTWVDGMMRSMPEHEFILWTIADSEEKGGKFVYELPDNVIEVHENFMDAGLNLRVRKNKNVKFSDKEKALFSELIRTRNPDWDTLLDSFGDGKNNPVEYFMSEDFLTILKDFSKEEYPFAGFTDLFWTIRSMFLQLFYLVSRPYPEADIYHSISTGYAGVIGGMASKKYQKPFILTEHGIYTREREEEILRADWVVSYFKEMWISVFYMFSKFAYQQADRVTSLFERASLIQQDIGCPPEKCDVVANGIPYDVFANIPSKKPNDWIDIGAIIRLAPIKDIKTMIYTFSRLKLENRNVRLHVLGGIDDEEYYQECLALVDYLKVKDILFKGVVDVKEYMKKLDFTLLTSISEGQPLSILESFASGRPVIATDVGCCKELIEGNESDTFGEAGICVPPMHQADLLQALMKISQDEELRKSMGLAGQRRVKEYYAHEEMVKNYNQVYQKAVSGWQE